ncbi:MAG: hypothetical protein ABIM42_01170 [candidate division WOR-3 bacterium]
MFLRILILNLFSVLPSSFFLSLEHFAKGEMGIADSLLNIAYFEADSFFKNDILFVKEIMSRYSYDEKTRSVLRDYLVWCYSSKRKENEIFSYQEIKNKNLKAFLKFQVEVSSSNALDSLLVRDFWEIEDTLLMFLSALKLIKKFGNNNKTLKSDVLIPLQIKYSQTPYFELISGYLR